MLCQICKKVLHFPSLSCNMINKIKKDRMCRMNGNKESLIFMSIFVVLVMILSFLSFSPSSTTQVIYVQAENALEDSSFISSSNSSSKATSSKSSSSKSSSSKSSSSKTSSSKSSSSRPLLSSASEQESLLTSQDSLVTSVMYEDYSDVFPDFFGTS